MTLFLLAMILFVIVGPPAAVTAFAFTNRALWTGVKLPDPPADHPPDRRLRFGLKVMARECASTFRVGMAWPLGLPNPRPSADKGRTPTRPVLLLPGYGLTRSSMWPLQRWLAKHDLLVSSFSPPLFAPPRRSAGRLAGRIRAVSSGSGDRPVDIVAFGASGVLLGEVLAADPDVPLGRVVALGTPWRGSPTAVFLPGPGAPPLLPDRPDLGYWSELLVKVLDGPLPTPQGEEPWPDADAPRRISIESADDPWVPPPLGQAPPGATRVLLHGTGHLHLLHHAGARDAVLEALRPGHADGDEVEVEVEVEAS